MLPALGAHHSPPQFVITSAETYSPAAWPAFAIASTHAVITAFGGPWLKKYSSSMSRSTPSNPFEVAKPIRLETNCARFVLLQAVGQLLLPAPPIAMIALIPGCECTVATQTGTLMFWMLSMSRPGPFSVARLNRINWFMSSHGKLAGGTGAQPMSSVMRT